MNHLKHDHINVGDSEHNDTACIPNLCEGCGKETKEAYEIPSGDYVCLSCYTEMADRAEAAYDAQREAEAGGN